jgi:4-aminobutyrate aminotransferase
MPKQPSSRIRGILAADGKVLLTTTRLPYVFMADRADGDFAYDVNGKRYIDFSSFIAVYNFGSGSIREVKSAVKKQTDKLMHAAFYDFYSELPVEFAARLLGMFPKGFGRVFFSNSGTEANEAALKFARIFTGRPYSIAFYGGFHGRTLGSLSLTASKSKYRKRFGPFANVVHAPYAYCYRCPLGKEYPSCGVACADYIEDYVLGKDVSADEVGAIFVEPVQGEGGYIVPPVEFLQKIRRIADRNGMVLVSDEVQAGYMRTGKFLGMDNFGIEADIYTMAKALGGGLPFGATITRSSLGDVPSGSHSSTFGGNLVSVAAADALLGYVNRNKARLERYSHDKGAYMRRRLEEMKERYEIVGDVRGIGMMMGMEIVKSKMSKEPGIKEVEGILKSCFASGLLLMPAGISTIRIIPPITMSMANLSKGLDTIEAAVRGVSKL